MRSPDGNLHTGLKVTVPEDLFFNLLWFTTWWPLSVIPWQPGASSCQSGGMLAWDQWRSPLKDGLGKLDAFVPP